MDQELISVSDVARHHGKRKQTVFKVLKRLEIDTTKRRSSASRNQVVSYITQDDFRRVSAVLQAIVNRDDSEESGGD
jgi:hypothetical protein